MNLNRKIQAALFVSLAAAVIFMCFLGYRFHKIRSNDINAFYSAQAYHVSNTIQILVGSVESEVINLSHNKAVAIAIADDSEFTNFLNADENTFTYKYSEREKTIIQIFDAVRKSYPYINSVYMGRKNGSFVRSHPRNIPTRYDPRVRPWYKDAMKNISSVCITEPYASLTEDVANIAVVKALTDKSGKAYGVVGIDITLDKLSSFLGEVKLFKGSYWMLVDKDGVILTNPDPKVIFKKINETEFAGLEPVLRAKSGLMKIRAQGAEWAVYYDTNARFGWKILAMVPTTTLRAETGKFILIMGVFIIVYLAAALVFMRYSSKKISQPFSTLLAEMKALAGNIKSKKGPAAVFTSGNGEAGAFAEAFNQMAAELSAAYGEIEKNYLKLEKIDKMKTTFIAAVSHELKTPLFIIDGAWQMLSSGGEIGPEKENELRKIINANIKRLKLTIADLIDVSLLEAGMMSVKSEPVDLVGLIREIIDQVSLFSSRKSMEIEFSASRPKIHVNGDKARLEQVFYNIIFNSVKFSGRNTRADISIKISRGCDITAPEGKTPDKNETYSVITISDTGPGFSMDEKERIFEMFYQSGDVMTRQQQGLGVGLSIAEGIIKAHKGLIWADSKGEGKGACFTVLLKNADSEGA